tara:strand:+ start:344 stop:520 length:177 start_codon:yes stop_codon:yes gene_type:complete
MEIKNAKYNKHDISGENVSIDCKINNRFCSVPINEENRHYKEIKKQVDAGTLTIEEAD